MKQTLIAALLLGAAVLAAPAAAQPGQSITQSISGTRLDVNATGEVTRVPDVAVISAGVVTRQATASAAIQEAAARMERVRAALKRAGIDDRDIQTSNVSLNPEYRYVENQPPQLTGYTATNQLSVRFRDIRSSGRFSMRWSAKAPTRSTGPISSSTSPKQRSTRRAPRRSLRAERGPSSMLARSECAWSASFR